ncbi:MAG: tetratricopeptide repeat protein [Psychrobacter sp.]|nr:tetratricopeptide repeat protein [Psychrobacter sp.]
MSSLRLYPVSLTISAILMTVIFTGCQSQPSSQSINQSQPLLTDNVKVTSEKPTSEFSRVKAKAEAGDKEAQYDLADMYFRGVGVEKNYQTAVKWFLVSAQQNYEYAQEMMAMVYYSGYGVPQDYGKAKQWLDLLISKNNPKAQNLLATMYTYGQGVEQDNHKALTLFRQAANQGYKEAQFNLGLAYEKGRGVEQDYEQAFHWYYEAARQSFPPAVSKVMLLKQSHSLKEPLLDNQSVEILAMEGDAKAQTELARIFKLTENNNAMAIFWYQKAAEQGYMEAQYHLGLLYHQDDTQPHDYTKAKYWYDRACQNGHEPACQQLAILKTLKK